MDRKRTLLLMGLMLLLVTLPYLYAFQQNNAETVFGGFLINNNDGYSYLAKMYQGREGSWQFTLPFTPEPGEPTYLFLFYLFLGHVARWTALPMIVVFHAARLIATGFLVFAVSAFFRESVFPEHPRMARLSTFLALFGSGMGWMLAVFRIFTMDLWVADAYPFLAAYTNPHFPLGFAMMLTIFNLVLAPLTGKRAISLFFLGLLLAVILPFGLVVVGVMCAGKFLWDSIETRTFQPWKYVALFGGGLPVLCYQLLVAAAHPVLSIWNAQNVTISPPLWDALISLLPALFLAPVGIRAAWRSRQKPGMRLLLIWFVLGAVLVYFPVSLQRRFFMAYYVPVAGMAILGVQALPGDRLYRWLIPVLLMVTVPTNMIMVFSGMFGVASQEPVLVRTVGEMEAFDWIQANTPEDALILTGPDTGLFIPGLSGRRVVYGHCYETANAADQSAKVTSFFSGAIDPIPFLDQNDIDYILYGPREQKLGQWNPPPGYAVAFSSGDTTIYQRETIP